MAADSTDASNSAIRALSELPERAHRLWVDKAPAKVREVITSASETTGISEKYLVCFTCMVMFYILVGRGSDLFFRLLSTVFPGYASFKALEAIRAPSSNPGPSSSNSINNNKNSNINNAETTISGSNSDNSPEAHLVRRWLTYWAVFGVISAIDFLIPAFVARAMSLWLFKSILVVWCMIPVKPNGAEFLYTRYLGPNFKILQATFSNLKDTNPRRAEDF